MSLIEIGDKITELGHNLLPFSFFFYLIFRAIAYVLNLSSKFKLVKAIWYMMSAFAMLSQDTRVETIVMFIAFIEAYDLTFEYLEERKGESSLGKPSKIRNDKTGNWREVVTSKKFDAKRDALKYRDNYMKDNEIHFIISLVSNTTTIIRNHRSYLSVDITEYEDKEERNAETIGSGRLLARYNIKENGEVEELNID